MALTLGLAANVYGQSVDSPDAQPRWSGARILTEADAFATAPSLAVDENGLHLMFQELRVNGNCTVVYMHSSTLGKTWDRTIRLGRSWQMGKGTSLLSDRGVLHAAWCPSEKGWNGIIYRSSADGGVTWSPDVEITSTETPIFFPQFQTDGDLLYVAWCEKQIIGPDGRPVSPATRDLDPALLASDVALTVLAGDGDYDCTLLMKVSSDGGMRWSERQRIDQVFENILTYKFTARQGHLAFRYRTPRSWLMRESDDQGLTWTNRRSINREEYGDILLPIEVRHRGETIRVGTNVVGNNSVVYVERTDSTPPDSHILSPGEVISSASVTIQWFGEDDWTLPENLVFSHRLNNATFSAFENLTVRTFGPLDDGEHRVAVRARDVAGNVDPEPAEIRFQIAVPPETQLLTTVPSPTRESNPLIQWTGSDNTTPAASLVYDYRIDGGDWVRTRETSVKTPTLYDGSHRFEVRAVDEAGNEDPTPAQTTFVVDTRAPTTLSVKVEDYVEGSSVIVVAVRAEDNQTPSDQITFSYRVDDGEWSEFAPTIRLQALRIPDGMHSLDVRARDAAGNTEAVPRTERFKVAISPRVDILTKPSGVISPREFTIVCRVTDNSEPGQEPELSYRVNGGLWSSYVRGEIVTISDPKLEDGRHQLEIRARDVYGNVSRNPAIWFFEVSGEQPSPPGGFTADRQDRSVALAWDNPRRGEAKARGWNVYRSTDPTFGGATELEKSRVQHLITERRLTDTPPGTDENIIYFYAVTVVDERGQESGLSVPRRVVFTRPGSTEVLTSAAPDGPRFISAAMANLLLLVGLVAMFLVILSSVIFVIRRKET